MVQGYNHVILEKSLQFYLLDLLILIFKCLFLPLISIFHCPRCHSLTSIPESAPAGQPLGVASPPGIPQPSAFVICLFLPFTAAGTFPWESLGGEGRRREMRARGSDCEQEQTHPSTAKISLKAPRNPRSVSLQAKGSLPCVCSALLFPTTH